MTLLVAVAVLIVFLVCAWPAAGQRFLLVCLLTLTASFALLTVAAVVVVAVEGDEWWWPILVTERRRAGRRARRMAGRREGRIPPSSALLPGRRTASPVRPTGSSPTRRPSACRGTRSQPPYAGRRAATA